MVNHFPTKFGGHRHCGSIDIMLSVTWSYVTRLCDFMDGSTAIVLTIFSVHWCHLSENVTYLICHMSSQDQIIAESRSGHRKLTMNIEKAFNSFDYNFLISTLRKCGFCQNFMLWLKILLKDQESFVINGRKTTSYLLLGRYACQADPYSWLLFILVLEISFLFINIKPLIARLTIFGQYYLYTT